MHSEVGDNPASPCYSRGSAQISGFYTETSKLRFGDRDICEKRSIRHTLVHAQEKLKDIEHKVSFMLHNLKELAIWVINFMH